MRHTFIAMIAVAIPAAVIAAPAPSWTVDKARSSIAFTGAMNGQAFTGRFARWDAKIAFDPKALPASSVTATIDTGSATTGDATRDQALPTGDWFSTAAFPRATFEARQFKDVGGGRYQAIGTLAIRNVRRPVVLPFQLAINGRQAHMVGMLTIDRRTFGVGAGQFAGTEMVAAEVKIRIDLTATR